MANLLETIYTANIFFISKEDTTIILARIPADLPTRGTAHVPRISDAGRIKVGKRDGAGGTGKEGGGKRGKREGERGTGKDGGVRGRVARGRGKEGGGKRKGEEGGVKGRGKDIRGKREGEEGGGKGRVL